MDLSMTNRTLCTESHIPRVAATVVNCTWCSWCCRSYNCNRVTVLVRSWINSCVCSPRRSDTCGVEMVLVALQAEEWLILLQQVISNGAVRVVTNGAIFLDRLMFEHKRALVAAVAVEAEVSYALFGFKAFNG